MDASARPLTFVPGENIPVCPQKPSAACSNAGPLSARHTPTNTKAGQPFTAPGPRRSTASLYAFGVSPAGGAGGAGGAKGEEFPEAEIAS